MCIRDRVRVDLRGVDTVPHALGETARQQLVVGYVDDPVLGVAPEAPLVEQRHGVALPISSSSTCLLYTSDLAARGVDNEGISYFDGLNTNKYRITLVGEDGSVLYDKMCIRDRDNRSILLRLPLSPWHVLQFQLPLFFRNIH